MAKLIVGVNDLATVNPELAKEWDYEKNEKTPQDYTSGSGQKVWWKCSKGHEWQSIIDSRVRNNLGCPICSNKQVLKGYNDFGTNYPALLLEWDFEKNIDISPYLYTAKSNQLAWWRCEKGHSWKARIQHRVNGVGCPVCSNKVVLKGFNDLATLYPNIAMEWNYDKNATLTPLNIVSGSLTKVWWKCKEGHEWQASPVTRIKGHSCPYCAGLLPIVGLTDLATVKPLLLKEWDYEKNNIEPTNITAFTHKKVWWRCENNHEWLASIAHRSNGTDCPYCNGSKTERLVYSYLKEIKIPFIAEKKFEQDIRVQWFPFDVWISSKRLIIEPDGLQHFTNKIGYFEQDIPFEKRRQNDNIKNQFCLEQKIPILRIPYTYNPDTEKEKIKSMIKDFIETRKIPQEIIDFYEQYKESNNYAEIARKINEKGNQEGNG